MILGCDVDVFDRYIRGYSKAPNAILEVRIQPFRPEQLPLMFAARRWKDDSNAVIAKQEGAELAKALDRHPRPRSFALTSWVALFAVYDVMTRQLPAQAQPSSEQLAAVLARAPVDSLLQQSIDSMHAEYSRVIVNSLRNERGSDIQIAEGVDAVSVTATLLAKTYAAVVAAQTNFTEQSFRHLLLETTHSQPMFTRGSAAAIEILIGRVKNSPAFKYTRDASWRAFDQ